MSPCLRWAGMNLGMNVSAWLETVTIALRLAQWQQFGLAFLLGSFAVATWSTSSGFRPSANSWKSGFSSFWQSLASICITSTTATRTPIRSLSASSGGLIATFLLALVRKIGILLSLVPADVGALAAAASLLPPILVVIFYFLAKVLAMIVGPLLARPTDLALHASGKSLHDRHPGPGLARVKCFLGKEMDWPPLVPLICYRLLATAAAHRSAPRSDLRPRTVAADGSGSRPAPKPGLAARRPALLLAR